MYKEKGLLHQQVELVTEQAKQAEGINDIDVERPEKLLNANYEGKPDINITFRTDQQDD